MSEYFENIGQLEDLKKRKEICKNAINSHKESIRNALPLVGEAEEINGEYVLSLAIKLNENLLELEGYNKKIEILSRAVGK